MAEFLEVMQPRSKGNIWSNDALPSRSKDGVAKKAKKDRQESTEAEDQDDDLYEDLPDTGENIRKRRKERKVESQGIFNLLFEESIAYPAINVCEIAI